MAEREIGRSVTAPVFLSPTVDLDRAVVQLNTVSVGDLVTLVGDEGHHAAKVMRLQPGEQLDLVDGHGFRARGLVHAVTEGGLKIAVESCEQENSPVFPVTLVQALAKGSRDEMAVEICTELEVDRILPWQADRSIVRWNGTKASKGQQKWQNRATAAAKQSRRAFFPEVGQVVDTKELGALVERVTESGGLALLCHEEATQSIGNMFRAAQVRAGAEVLIIVGPEGGICAEELQSLCQAGASLISLGRTVVRSSTAGAMALTLVNFQMRSYD